MNMLMNRGALSPEQQAAAQAGTLKPDDVTDTNPSFAWAAGGVISTPNELARYVKALVDGGLLNDEMRRSGSIAGGHRSEQPKARYGYNIEAKGPFIGHGGDIPGFNSVMYHDPKRDLTIVAYTQLNVTPQGTQARRRADEHLSRPRAVPPNKDAVVKAIELRWRKGCRDPSGRCRRRSCQGRGRKDRRDLRPT